MFGLPGSIPWIWLLLCCLLSDPPGFRAAATLLHYKSTSSRLPSLPSLSSPKHQNITIRPFSKSHLLSRSQRLHPKCLTTPTSSTSPCPAAAAPAPLSVCSRSLTVRCDFAPLAFAGRSAPPTFRMRHRRGTDTARRRRMQTASDLRIKC